MATTGKLTFDEGTTSNTATYTISEDAVTKHIPRSVISTGAGVESGTAGSPFQVSLANTAANATAVKVDNSAVTQPVSGTITANIGTVATLATAAKQDTGNTSVGNVDTNLGAIADASVTAGATGSIHAKLRRISTDIASVITNTANIPAVGQALAAASTPVVLTAAQITTLTPPAAITGFATAAKQPALGTAGSASTDVITVQGIASGTAIKTDASATTQPISASSLPLPALAATSTKQSDGTQKTQVVDGSGNVVGSTSNALDVNIKSGSAGGTQYTEDAVAATDPVGNMLIARRKDTLSTTEVSADGDNIALNSTNKGQLHVKLADTVVVDGSAVTQPVSVASIPSHAVTNAGTFAVQAAEADGANVTLGAKADAKNTATDTTAVSAMSVLKQISASVQAPPSQAVTNAGTFAVQATLQANSGVDIGKLTANQSVNVAQINGVTPLMGAGNTGTGSQRVTIASDQVVIPVSDNAGSLTVDAPVGTPVFATLTPSTTGGWTPKSLIALSNTKTAVKAAAGTMGGYMLYNPNATVIYIQVWNVAIGSITVGSTAPTYVIPLPATTGANVEWTNGIGHTTEINVAATTTATGSTAPSTSIDGFMLYK